MKRDRNFRLSKEFKRLLLTSVEKQDRRAIKDLFIEAQIVAQTPRKSKSEKVEGEEE